MHCSLTIHDKRAARSGPAAAAEGEPVDFKPQLTDLKATVAAHRLRLTRPSFMSSHSGPKISRLSLGVKSSVSEINL